MIEIITLTVILLIANFLVSCKTQTTGSDPVLPVDPDPVSTDSTLLKTKKWQSISIPDYSYPDGTLFDGDLFVDVAFDPQGVSIQGDKLYFHIDPENPITPDSSISPNNYRSEIHTAPWNIEHPRGTEQWIGWRYYFASNYIIDTSSPITIFQNHPGVLGMSPTIELELARVDQIPGATGGEIQVINSPSNERILTKFRPEAGDSIDIVIQLVHDLGEEGYLRVWFDDELVFEQKSSTIYNDYPWGGNNDPSEVLSSQAVGAGIVDLSMGTLRMITRASDHHEYRVSAYDLVKPNQ